MSESTPHRRFERVAVDVPVRVSTIDPERDGRTGRSCFLATGETCANLSPGGAFIRTREPFTPGRRVLVELHLPDRGSVEAVGRVAWSRPLLGPRAQSGESGVGVEFVDGAPAHRSALERWLATRRTRARRGTAGRTKNARTDGATA